jgi:hypothetical protein
MFRALVALIVVASRVSYLLLRCVPPHGVFSAELQKATELSGADTTFKSNLAHGYAAAGRRGEALKML